MLRSMYAGISGMKVNQTKLDVTGNNIANVSTTGFKSSRVRFKDMLSQNMGEAVGPGRSQGGVNGKQVGLGVQVAGIDTVMSQGMMQPTSRNLDVAMDGTGYFIVAKGALPESNAGGIAVSESEHTMSGGAFQVNYTRDGSFTLDHQGNLLTSDGYRVMGYAIKEGSIEVKNEGDNANGDEGKTTPKESPNKELSINYSKNGMCSFINADGKYGLKAENSLVPLRIPDAVHINATQIGSTDDNNGIDMNFVGTGDTTGKDFAHAKISTGGAKYPGKEPLKIEVKYVEKKQENKEAGYHVFINGKDSGEVSEFSNDKLKEFIPELQDKDEKKGFNINITAPGKIPDADKSKYKWEFTLQPECDKKLRSFAIEKDGLVKGVLDDGSVTALGQIATASFKNQEGLKKEGKNLYSNTANSGVPTVRSGIGTPKNLDNGDGYGEMLQGMLEMSNVDLAEQFTDMIVTTRAFQASGKMISTGDEILQDIINLKR